MATSDHSAKVRTKRVTALMTSIFLSASLPLLLSGCFAKVAPTCGEYSAMSSIDKGLAETALLDSHDLELNGTNAMGLQKAILKQCGSLAGLPGVGGGRGNVRNASRPIDEKIDWSSNRW